MENKKIDITNGQQVEILVNTFYEQVRRDELIGGIFNSIIGDKWGHHLPIMYSFWKTILLKEHGYIGNPAKKHVEIDKKIQLTEEHFQRWLQLWNATIDNIFEGPVAEEAKRRAVIMKNLLSMKVSMARESQSIM